MDLAWHVYHSARGHRAMAYFREAAAGAHYRGCGPCIDLVRTWGSTGMLLSESRSGSVAGDALEVMRCAQRSSLNAPRFLALPSSSVETCGVVTELQL